MSLWRQLTRGVRTLIRPSSADQAVADEVDHFFEETVESLVADGHAPDQARRLARIHVGGAMAVREEVRSAGWEHTIETLVADLRYGVRRLRRSPGFVSVAAVTLALGIGASTAIFSAVKPVLLEPLPYPDARRLVMIWDTAVGSAPLDVTFGTYRELVERTRAFESMAVTKPWQPTLTGPNEPERLDGQRVSASYFQLLGVPPLAGRPFDPADDRPGGARVVMLSHRVWHQRFLGDPAIVGRTITLDDNPYTVVGVMPPTFENVLSPAADVWSLLQYNALLPVDGREWGHHLRLVARLRSDVSIEGARRELEEIAGVQISRFARPAWAAMRQGLTLVPLQEDISGAVRPALVAVIGAVLLMLLIACVNVTGLLLARGSLRRGEFAVRAALGASRGRILRQMMTESLLLAGIGGVLGILVAQFGLRALVALSPSELPRAGAMTVDAVALAFALATTTLTGLAVGVLPAFQTVRGDLHRGAQQISRRTARGSHVTRRALVVAEIALALVLLTGAGLLMRSLQRLFAISPGFHASDLLTMQVQTAGRRFDTDTTNRFFARALNEVRAVPGVTAAAFTSQLPLSGDRSEYGVTFEKVPDEGGGFPAFRYSVSGGYFEAMGIPLRSGRFLTERDTAGAPPVAVISESLARGMTGNPIGQRLRAGPANRPWQTIVGVVGDVKQASLAATDDAAVYMTSEQWAFADTPRWLVVRTRSAGPSFTAALRTAIWAIDKDQPIVRVATMNELLADTAAQRRFALIVFQIFGLAALILAAIGIYGVLSGHVSERMHEIGVRAALGASRADLLSLIMRQGLTITAVGVILGLAGGLAASGALVTLLFGVTRLDPWTYAGVAALLFAVSTLACAIPAARAAWVDPSVTLRAE